MIFTTQTCASFCVCVSPSLRTHEKTYLLSMGKPRLTCKPPVDLLTVAYLRCPLTYLRWPTSGDLLRVTYFRWPQGDHEHYFLAMTSLWPWSHTSRIPRSHTTSLSSRAHPFFILIHFFFHDNIGSWQFIGLVLWSISGLFISILFNFSTFKFN